MDSDEQSSDMEGICELALAITMAKLVSCMYYQCSSIMVVLVILVALVLPLSFLFFFRSQVSQLVILHEEAADGKIVHDLTLPVKAVDAAVQNLVVVR